MSYIAHNSRVSQHVELKLRVLMIYGILISLRWVHMHHQIKGMGEAIKSKNAEKVPKA